MRAPGRILRGRVVARCYIANPTLFSDWSHEGGIIKCARPIPLYNSRPECRGGTSVRPAKPKPSHTKLKSNTVILDLTPGSLRFAGAGRSAAPTSAHLDQFTGGVSCPKICGIADLCRNSMSRACAAFWYVLLGSEGSDQTAS